MLMIIKSLFFLYYVSLISLNTNVCGFSVDIFHIYSPESPYYDPSLSPTQIIVHAIQRSVNRVQWVNESHPADTGSGSTETDIVRSLHGTIYLMRYKIGINEVPSIGMLDTGSDLIWTQCFPCKRCFVQSPPHYVPSSSSTYKAVLCNETECKLLRLSSCDHYGQTNFPCSYFENYADQADTTGLLSKDTFTLASEGGTTTRIPDIVFGCSSTANGHGFAGYESGYIGLGRGPLSLVSQLRHFAKGKFSYCMLLLSETKKRSTRLIFGEYSEVMPGAGEPVVHIPLFQNQQDPSHYYITLIGFSVWEKKFLQYPDEANFIVDSGTFLTRLPNYMYIHLKKYVTSALGHLKTKPDPYGVLDLCFATRSKQKLPPLTLHFGNYANITFGDNHMFGQMDDSTLCLLVLSAQEGKASLGSMAQANFLVGYDTELERMSFRRTDCSKLAF